MFNVTTWYVNIHVQVINNAGIRTKCCLMNKLLLYMEQLKEVFMTFEGCDFCDSCDSRALRLIATNFF